MTELKVRELSPKLRAARIKANMRCITVKIFVPKVGAEDKVTNIRSRLHEAFLPDKTAIHLKVDKARLVEPKEAKRMAAFMTDEQITASMLKAVNQKAALDKDSEEE